MQHAKLVITKKQTEEIKTVLDGWKKQRKSKHPIVKIAFILSTQEILDRVQADKDRTAAERANKHPRCAPATARGGLK